MTLTPTVQASSTRSRDALGLEFDPKDPAGGRARARPAGPVHRRHAPAHGEPDEAGGRVQGERDPGAGVRRDRRTLPAGLEDEYFAEIDKLLGPGVTREFTHYDIALEAPFEVPLVETMMASLQAEDPAARIVPYCLSAGTDNKTFGVMDMGRGGSAATASCR